MAVLGSKRKTFLARWRKNVGPPSFKSTIKRRAGHIERMEGFRNEYQVLNGKRGVNLWSRLTLFVYNLRNTCSSKICYHTFRDSISRGVRVAFHYIRSHGLSAVLIVFNYAIKARWRVGIW